MVKKSFSVWVKLLLLLQYSAGLHVFLFETYFLAVKPKNGHSSKFFKIRRRTLVVNKYFSFYVPNHEPWIVKKVWEKTYYRIPQVLIFFLLNPFSGNESKNGHLSKIWLKIKNKNRKNTLVVNNFPLMVNVYLKLQHSKIVYNVEIWKSGNFTFSRNK